MSDSIQRVFDLIARLRGPDGCPWDRAQSLDDVLSDLIEEAYELEWAGRSLVASRTRAGESVAGGEGA